MCNVTHVKNLPRGVLAGWLNSRGNLKTRKSSRSDLRPELAKGRKFSPPPDVDASHQGVRFRRMVLDWLLDSDPAIRWQVLRDLADAPAEVVAAERGRVATEGWGARLLALQGEDGQWAGGACFPARRFMHPDDTGQPWTSTLPSLQLLHDFGIDPSNDRV